MTTNFNLSDIILLLVYYHLRLVQHGQLKDQIETIISEAVQQCFL